jgi:hypothetical protein
MERVAQPSGGDADGGQQGPGPSEGSQVIPLLPLLLLNLRPPYNSLSVVTLWLSDYFGSLRGRAEEGPDLYES